MSGLVDWTTDDDELRVGRRRFRRRRDDREPGTPDDADDAELRAELLLLREENARLKAAQHQVPDASRALHSARALAVAAAHPDLRSDDAHQLVVEGLVIRESLLVICQEIERSMVAFEARLSALGALDAGPLPDDLLDRHARGARVG